MNKLATRRSLLQMTAAVAITPFAAHSSGPRRIKWSELIPEGTEYGEIVAYGTYDKERDIWLPEFDENGLKLNTDLDGAEITLAGYMIPLEFTSEGVTDFVLVPFVGACIHVPPPPPNQIVFVRSDNPWPQGNLWDALLVTGQLKAQRMTTDVAQVGYELAAMGIENFRR